MKTKKKYSKKGGSENTSFSNIPRYNKSIKKKRSWTRTFERANEPGECNWNKNPVGKKRIAGSFLTFDKNYVGTTNVKTTIKISDLVKKNPHLSSFLIKHTKKKYDIKDEDISVKKFNNLTLARNIYNCFNPDLLVDMVYKIDNINFERPDFFYKKRYEYEKNKYGSFEEFKEEMIKEAKQSFAEFIVDVILKAVKDYEVKVPSGGKRLNIVKSLVKFCDVIGYTKGSNPKDLSSIDIDSFVKHLNDPVTIQIVKEIYDLPESDRGPLLDKKKSDEKKTPFYFFFVAIMFGLAAFTNSGFADAPPELPPGFV